jgi:hypothetical protein
VAQHALFWGAPQFPGYRQSSPLAPREDLHAEREEDFPYPCSGDLKRVISAESTEQALWAAFFPHGTMCPPMRRRFFQIAAVVCLLLCTAMMCLWIRSLSVEDDIYRIHRFYLSKDTTTTISFQTTFISTSGSIGIARGREYINVPRRLSDAEFPEAVRWSWSSRPPVVWTDSSGFSFYKFGGQDIYEKHWLIPIWIPVWIFGVVPVIWWRQRIARWRQHGRGFPVLPPKPH